MASPASKSRQTEGKKSCESCRPGAWEPAAAILPPAIGPRPRPARRRARLPHLATGSGRCPRGVPRPRLGTYLAPAFERAGPRGFHLGFQTSFREEEGGKKKKKKSNYANGLRTGSSALDLTPLPLELWSSPGRGFMGARHGYARSRRRSIAKLIKAVMSTFPATLRAGWAAPPSARPRGAGALPPPRLLPPLPAPPLFPLFLPLRAFSSLSSL